MAAAEAAARVRIREIVLSSDQVSERSGKLQLVSIRSDLTTTIRTPTGEVVTGRPGDFFACREYGSAGLQLVAASPQNGEALFEERVVLP